MLILAFQETAVPSRPFDPDVVWQVFSQLFARLMAHLPYLILGVIVFVFFLVAARLVRRILITAGRRTRLDLTLADLLGRLASAFTIILGLFVAAVVIFPTFNPGDLIAGLGITSVAIGFAFKDVLSFAQKLELRACLRLNSNGVRKFQPRVASTLGNRNRNRINSEGVRERFQR